MSAESVARAAWGAALPEWVEALARACDSESQAAVARRLGYSPSVVSQVLGAKYGAGLGAVETAVRQVFLAAAVACPVLGEITGERCREEQRKPFAATSSFRVRLWRACRACSHNLHQEARTS